MANVVEILITAKNLTGPAMAAVNAEVNKAGKGMAAFHKTAGIAALGVAAIGVESVKMAARFDSEMTLLQTQAGVSADKIDGLKKGVLGLAGKVGQDPDSLAEALFHVESNFASMGITSKEALKLTEVAAKGATIGHADLVDVTNALTAAVAAGIPGVENLDQAMGVLNATVGSGDMKMQDLASAFGSGMVATVKGFGLSIYDVGAALATFGDNNIRGALAGTQLRMSVMALAKPIAGGADALAKLGLHADTLANDMQQGGLKLALEDLVTHMEAAGISADEQGQIITDAFGRKAGAGLNILVGQLPRFESKISEIKNGAKNFSRAWEDTQKTFAFQMKSMQTGFEALMIGVGQKMIPPLQAFIGFLKEHKGASIGATEALGGLLVAVVAVSAALKVAAGVKLAWAGITAGALAAKGAMETFALKAMYMRDASIAAGGGLKGLGAAFGTLSTGAKLAGVLAVVAGVALAMHELAGGSKAAPDVDKMTTALGEFGRTGAVTGVLKGNLKDLSESIAMVSKSASGNKLVQMASDFGTWIGVAKGPGVGDAKKNVDALDKSLAALVQGGHADLAAAASKRLEKAWIAGGGTAKRYKDTMNDYQGALDDAKLTTGLAADSQGRFGDKAAEVQLNLQAQQDAVDALKQSYLALDQVNQDAYDSQTKLQDAIAATNAGVKENGRTLSLYSDGGRRNRDLITAQARAAGDYITKLYAQYPAEDTLNTEYQKNYDQLVKSQMALGKTKAAAEGLTSSLFHVPTDIIINANIKDAKTKMHDLAAELKKATKPRAVEIKARLTQMQNVKEEYERDLAELRGDATIRIHATYSVGVNGKGTNMFHEQGDYGTNRAMGGMVTGPGSGTSDDVPAWLSNGEFVVNAAATAKHRGLLEAINGGKHGMAAFAKGGKVSKARQAAIDRAGVEHGAASEAMGYLNISHFGQVAGYRASNFENATGRAASVGDLAQTLNEWQSKIKAATHGAQESGLVKSFDRFGAAALKNEKTLLSVNSRLGASKDKLSSLRDSFAQLRDSVASSVVSFGSIVKQGGGGPFGQISVKEQLRGSVGQAREFAADLARLKKMGLNAQSLSEIAGAGIEGGGIETANRLLGSSPGDIKEINSLEKQLQAAGKVAGASAADVMYGGGIKAAEGMVKGLEKEQHRIEKVMAAAADAMANQLKRAFGVGRKASGGVVGAAASGGNRWGRTLVGEYGPEIADLPVGSRVHSAPDTQRMLAAGGDGRVPPIEITLMIGDTTLGTVLVDPLSKVIRSRGGNVQAVLGVRGK